MDSVAIVRVNVPRLQASFPYRNDLMFLKTMHDGFSKTARKPLAGTSIAICLNCQQDAQKGRSARPQRAKMRSVRFGTLSF
jgi:hypothetical protein